MFKRACCYVRPDCRELALEGVYFRWLQSLRTVFEKIPGIFWETVSPKSKIFREFLGFWYAGEFLKKNPGISGLLVRRGILVKIPGNCAVFVFPGISNYVSGSLRDFNWFELFSMIEIGLIWRDKICWISLNFEYFWLLIQCIVETILYGMWYGHLTRVFWRGILKTTWSITWNIFPITILELIFFLL